MLSFFPYIWRNLLRNKRRTILTTLAIAMAVFIFSALNSITATMKKVFEVETTQYIRLLTRERYGNPGMILLPDSYSEKIKNVPGVIDVLPFSFFGGRANADPGVFVRGLASDAVIAARIFGDQWNDIPTEQVEAYQNERTAIMVGETTMKKFGWKLGQQVQIKLIFPRPGKITAHIVGVGKHPRFANWAAMHREYLTRETKTVGRAMGFWMTVASENDAARVSTTVDEMFKNGPIATKTETEKAFFGSITGWMGGFLAMVSGLSILVLIVTGVVCLNSISMSVRERIPEFGLLKSLGYRASHLMFFVLGESALAATFGGILGLIAAKVILTTVGTRAILFVERTELQMETLILSFFVAILLGLISGLPPAIRAARIRPVEALRTVE